MFDTLVGYCVGKGYGLGSSIVMFRRVGGGIYTKAPVDVCVELAGKVCLFCVLFCFGVVLLL